MRTKWNSSGVDCEARSAALPASARASAATGSHPLMIHRMGEAYQCVMA